MPSAGNVNLIGRIAPRHTEANRPVTYIDPFSHRNSRPLPLLEHYGFQFGPRSLSTDSTRKSKDFAINQAAATSRASILTSVTRDIETGVAK